MCVSSARAEFSGTTLFVGRRNHPLHGLIHVLGYQNTAVNLASGPNAMLLHLPARSVTQGNFLSAGGCSTILESMVEALLPVSRGVGPVQMDSRTRGAVEVFDHDIYTVVLADDPTLIRAALGRVPARKRPALDPELLRFYADHYPDHTIALCCFDNTEARKAKPLLLWYEPLDPDLLVAPSLDSHTGGAPDLDARVPVDHWLLFGTDEAPDGWGSPVRYPFDMPTALHEYLPPTVMGTHAGYMSLANGDFAIAHEDLLAGHLGRIGRLQPSA
ncbi:hypothetical protein ACWCYY_05130 [Kitasatospora sp. NPDC001664]